MKTNYNSFELSNENPTNGEYCIKLIYSNAWDWFEFYENKSEVNNSIFEIIFNVTHNGTIRICGVIEYTDNSQTITYLENRNILPDEESPFTVTITAENGKSIKNIGCRVILINQGVAYLDNISCKIIQ